PPVADPHAFAFFPFGEDPRAIRGRERTDVRRLVPRPSAPGPAARDVDLAQALAEREDTVEPTEVERRHLLGTGHGAMVRVVEEDAAAAAPLPELADPPHDRRIGPLVDDRELAAVERTFEIQRVGVVARRREGRVRAER